MLKNPKVYVLTLSAPQVLAKPAVGVVFDADVTTDLLRPLFKLLVVGYSTFFISIFLFLVLVNWLGRWLHVKDCHYLISTFIFLHKLLNLTANAGQPRNVEDGRPLDWVLI